MIPNNYIFVNVTFDSFDITKNKVWNITLKSAYSILYVEFNVTKHDGVNDSLYEKLIEHSYFQCLSEADADLKILKLSDNDEDYFPVNAYINGDNNKTKEKIKTFLNDVYEKNNNEIPLTFVFDNSYEMIYLYNFIYNITDEGVIEFLPHISKYPVIMDTIINSSGIMDAYLTSNNQFIMDTINKYSNENEICIIIKRLRPILQLMSLESVASLILDPEIMDS